LQAVLTVPPNSSTVSGTGVLTQAISPPLHGDTTFHGVVHVVGGLPPAQPKQVYALHGDPHPALITTYVVELSIALDGI
jgi:hypothetical protein